MPARRRLVLALAAAGALASIAFGRDLRGLFGQSPPDALWGIVDECVGKPGAYCECPDFAKSCCGDASAPDSAVVWALDADYVAIRDMRACGCPQGFVHGLALPRDRVSGIEDPRRPEGIWPFAWDVGRKHIAETDQIALVMNPEVARTQDQMHVHIVRLTDAARRLLDHPAPATSEERVVPLASLDAVFAAAAGAVGAAELHDHGILVAQAPSGDGWQMLLTRESSPEVYTIGSCR